MSPERRSLKRTDIEGILPHRRPFMFLESAEIVEPGVKAIGVLADLSHPDFAFLKGHFPSFPIVPGAILMETLAELSGIAVSSRASGQHNKIGVLRRDAMDYKQMVKPGDLVQLEAEVFALKMGIGRSRVKAIKDGKTVVEGEIVFALIDKPETQLLS
ncbi:MAG: 3-hydroxyacyl-[acyl-carrier-protein] dehydratase FabZ [Candidatus Levyibacteriota bacterium]